MIAVLYIRGVTPPLHKHMLQQFPDYNTLLNVPVSRSHSQEIFPVYFGSKYDAALEMLVWEFISRLEELLPVPDFTQVPCFFELAE